MAIHKVFSAKFEAWCLLARRKQTIRESSLCENCILYQFAKVFFSKVSHYAVVILQHNLRPIVVLPAPQVGSLLSLVPADMSKEYRHYP